MKKIILFLMSALVLFAAPKFLMPEEAFKAEASINDAMQIQAKVEIAKDIYLYSEKMKFEIKNNENISIAKVDAPEAVENHGDMAYTSSPSFLITLAKASDVEGMQSVEFVMHYQGCSEQGLCYEPLDSTYTFDIDTQKLSTSQESVTSQATQKAEAPQELSEVDSIAKTIGSENVLWVVLSFLGIGLLLSLTPCVFPMIPIISGVIVSQGEGLTTKRAFFLSVVYVLAMAVAYTIAGVLAGLFGSNLQAALQTPWVIFSFSAIFVALAMSMFGYYELKLPDAIVNKVSRTSETKGGGAIGVAIMGFLSALIVGPCVAAPLAGALVYIGQTGDALLGGMALFALSIGMGIPLIAVGVSAGKFMPKPGAWMTMVTAIFGVMMLGIAIWMLERVVDPYITMLLYAMLGLGTAIYLGAFEREIHIFKKSVSLILFIYSLALFIGALGGSTSMSKPLAFLQPQVVQSASSSKASDVSFTKITSLGELDALLEKNKGKKILLDFSAEWCSVCKELDAKTFSDAAVKAKMSEFVLIKADVTNNGAEEKALSKKYGVFGPPAILFFDESGAFLKSKSIIGFIEAQEFVEHLSKI
ncbi:MAG: protein-disulfide reductase DsbD [Sulfurimonas sp.]|jgi:thiol:disulfide interchange protein DsbD|nr:protein-disulfide reductase DsbD [Sulfurimonas sp.]